MVAKKAKRSTTKKRAAPASEVLESITGSDALAVLGALAEQDDKLAEAIGGMVKGVHIIGDAMKPRGAMQAVREGFEVASKVGDQPQTDMDLHFFQGHSLEDSAD